MLKTIKLAWTSFKTVSIMTQPKQVKISSHKMERRTFDTPAREKWNPIICHMLRAVDNHNNMYFRTGNTWHLKKAAELRAYIIELKDWIKSIEVI